MRLQGMVTEGAGEGRKCREGVTHAVRSELLPQRDNVCRAEANTRTLSSIFLHVRCIGVTNRKDERNNY